MTCLRWHEANPRIHMTGMEPYISPQGRTFDALDLLDDEWRTFPSLYCKAREVAGHRVELIPGLGYMMVTLVSQGLAETYKDGFSYFRRLKQ